MDAHRPTSALARIPETGGEQRPEEPRRRRPQTAPLRARRSLGSGNASCETSRDSEWEVPSGADALAKALWLHQERLLVESPSSTSFPESMHSQPDDWHHGCEVLENTLNETLIRSKETVSQSRDVCAAFSELWARIHEGEVQIEKMRHDLYEEIDAHNLTKEQLLEMQAARRAADREAENLRKRANTAQTMYEDARRSLEAAVDATDASQVAEEVCAQTARELEDHAMHVATNTDAAGRAGRHIGAMLDVDVSAMQAELYELHEEREKTRQSLEEAAWKAAEALEVQQRLDDTLNCLADARKKLGNAGQALLKREGHIVELRLLLAERESHIADLERSAEDAKEREEQMSKEIEHLRARSEELLRQLADRADAKSTPFDLDSEAKLREAVVENARLKAELASFQAEAENLREQLRLKEDSEQKALADKDTLVARLEAHLQQMETRCHNEEHLRHVAEESEKKAHDALDEAKGRLHEQQLQHEQMQERLRKAQERVEFLSEQLHQQMEDDARKAELAALREELRDLQRQREADEQRARAQSQAAEDELAALRAELEDTRQKRETETSALREQLALHEQLAKAQSQDELVAALRTELADLQQQRDTQTAALRKQLAEAPKQAELAALRAELEDLQRQREANENSAKVQSRAHEAAQAELAALRAELAEWQQQCEADEQQAKFQLQAHEVAQAELAALRAELADLQQQHETDEEQAKVQLKAHEVAQAELAALRAELADLQRQREADEQQAKVQLKAHEVAQAELAALRAELAGWQRQREADEEQAKVQSQAHEAAQAKLATLRAELAELQRQREADENSAKVQSQAHEAAQAELAALRAELAEWQQQREADEQQAKFQLQAHEVAQAELAALRVQLADLQRQHETDEQQAKVQLQAHEIGQAKLAALRAELEDLQRQREADEQQAKVQLKAHEVAQAELAALRAELEDLQRQREADEQQAKVQLQAHEAAQAELAALRAELEDLQRQREADEQQAKVQLQAHDAAQAELAALRDDLVNLQRQHQADKQRAEEAAQAELAALHAQLADLRQQRDLNEQLAKAQSKDAMVALLRAELADVRRQRETQDALVASLRAELAELQQQREAETSGLSKQLAEADALLASLRAELTDLQQQREAETSELSKQLAEADALLASLRAEHADLRQQTEAETSGLRKQLAEAPSQDDLATLRAQLLDVQRQREGETAVLREQLAALELHVQEDIEDERDQLRRQVSSFVAREEAAECLGVARMAQANCERQKLQVQLRQWLSRTLVSERLLLMAQAFGAWATVSTSAKLQTLLSKSISFDKVARHFTSSAHAQLLADICGIWRNCTEEMQRKNAKKERSFAMAMRSLARSDAFLKAQIFKAWADLACRANERGRKMQAFEKHFGLSDLAAQCSVLSAWHGVVHAEHRRRTVRERCMNMAAARGRDHIELLSSRLLWTWCHLARMERLQEDVLRLQAAAHGEQGELSEVQRLREKAEAALATAQTEVERLQGELSESHRKQQELSQKVRDLEQQCSAAFASSGIAGLVRMAHRRALQRLDKQFVAEHEVLLGFCLSHWREMCSLRRRKHRNLHTSGIILSSRYRLLHVDILSAWSQFAKESQTRAWLKDSGMRIASSMIASCSTLLCHEVLAHWLFMTVTVRRLRKAKDAGMEKAARMVVSCCASLLRFCLEAWGLLRLECRRKEKSYQRASWMIAANATSLLQTCFVLWSNEHHKCKRKGLNHRRAAWITAMLDGFLQAKLFEAWVKAWARRKTEDLKEHNIAKALRRVAKEDAAFTTAVLLCWSSEAQKIKELRLQAYQQDYQQNALERLREELSEKASLIEAAQAGRAVAEEHRDQLREELRRRAQYSCSLWHAALGRQELVLNEAIKSEVIQAWRGHQLQEKRRRQDLYSRSLSCTALDRQLLLHDQALQSEVFQTWRQDQLREARRRRAEYGRGLARAALERQCLMLDEAVQSEVLQTWRRHQLHEKRRRQAEYSRALSAAALGRQTLLLDEAVQREVLQTWRRHQLQEKRRRRAGALSAAALGRQSLLLDKAVQNEVIQTWRRHQVQEKRRRRARSLLATAQGRQTLLLNEAVQSEVLQIWRRHQLKEKRRRQAENSRALAAAALGRQTLLLEEAIQSEVLQTWKRDHLQERRRRRAEYSRLLSGTALGRQTLLVNQAIQSEVFQTWRRDMLQEKFRRRAANSRSHSCAALERQMLLFNQNIRREVFMTWRHSADDELARRARKEQGFSCAHRCIHNVSQRLLMKYLNVWRLSVSSRNHRNAMSRGVEAHLSKQLKRACCTLLRDWHATAAEMCMRRNQKDGHLAAVAKAVRACEVAYLAIYILSWTMAVLRARISDQASNEALAQEAMIRQDELRAAKEESERLRAELSSAEGRIEDLERQLLENAQASQTEFETELVAQNAELEKHNAELEKLLEKYRRDAEREAESRRQLRLKGGISSALTRHAVSEAQTMKHVYLRSWRQAVLDVRELDELNARNILQTKRYADAMVKRVETKFLHLWARVQKARTHSRRLMRAMEAQYLVQERQLLNIVFALFHGTIWSSIVRRRQKRGHLDQVTRHVLRSCVEAQLTVCFMGWYARIRQIAQEDDLTEQERRNREFALSNNLGHSEAERNRLLEELDKARREAIKLQDSLTDSHGQQVQLSQQLEELRHQICRLEGEISVYKEREGLFHDAIQMSKQATARLVFSEEQFAKVKADLDDARRLRDGFQLERDDFKRQLSLAEIEMERQRAEGEGVKKQLAEAKVLLERVRLQDVTDVLRDARDVQEIEKRLKAMLGVATMTFERNQNEEAMLIGWLRRERDDSRSRLEQAERHCSELHETVRKRDRQLMNLTSELAQLRSHVRSGALRKSHDALGLQANMALLWLVFRSWLGLVLRSATATRAEVPEDDEFSLGDWQYDTPTSAQTSVQDSGTIYSNQIGHVPRRPSSQPSSAAPRRRNMSVGNVTRPASAFSSRTAAGAKIGRGKLIQQLADCSRWVGSDAASAVSTRCGTPELTGSRLGTRPSTAGAPSRFGDRAG